MKSPQETGGFFILKLKQILVPPATPAQSSGAKTSSHESISNNIISLRIITVSL